MGHRQAERFDFPCDRHTAVVVCSRVMEGGPVLVASRDDDGDWQFLCAGDHAENDDDPPHLVCLECTVARDLTLNEVADLCANHSAERDAPGSPWTRHDDAEQFILQAIADVGWAVNLIPAGDTDDEPAFAYTAGLFSSYGHAELIVVGLSDEVMHAMLNRCGEMIRDGRRLDTDTVDGVLDGVPVALRQIMTLESYQQHVGYALWVNDGPDFPLLQVVWPDRDGRMPWDPAAEPSLRQRQPLLP